MENKTKRQEDQRKEKLGSPQKDVLDGRREKQSKSTTTGKEKQPSPKKKK